MATVTVTKFKHRKTAKSNVVKKNVVAPSGRSVSIRSIPANSATFTDDFLRVFSANVKEAIRKGKKRLPRTRRAAVDS